MKYIIFPLLIFIFLFSTQAQAHNPYLTKQGVIQDPYGNKIIKEHLSGDGIFFSDPFRFQLRNAHGAVLAKSPVMKNITSFCPSLKFCWVFIYNKSSLLSIGLSPDLNKIDFHKSGKNYKFRPENRASFQEYLHDDDKDRFSSYVFGYPEHAKDKDESLNLSPSYFSAIFSPIFIVANHIPALLITILFSLSLSWLYKGLFWWKNIETKSLRYLMYLAYTLILLTYTWAILLFISSLSYIPVPYMIITTLITLIIKIRPKRADSSATPRQDLPSSL